MKDPTNAAQQPRGHVRMTQARHPLTCAVTSLECWLLMGAPRTARARPGAAVGCCCAPRAASAAGPELPLPLPNSARCLVMGPKSGEEAPPSRASASPSAVGAGVDAFAGRRQRRGLPFLAAAASLRRRRGRKGGARVEPGGVRVAGSGGVESRKFRCPGKQSAGGGPYSSPRARHTPDPAPSPRRPSDATTRDRRHTRPHLIRGVLAVQWSVPRLPCFMRTHNSHTHTHARARAVNTHVRALTHTHT
jgi:hypothetical protein